MIKYISCCKRGSSAGEVIIGTALVIFLILPLFSFIAEKYIIQCKVQIIKDAADIAAVSAYNAVNCSSLSRDAVSFSQPELMQLFRSMLADNLKLDSGLEPLEGSVAEGAVVIEELALYTSGFPQVCPGGTVLKRPAVHSVFTVPLKPSLYKRLLLDMAGRTYFPLKLHCDTDLPINN